jgi:hypothetical protein
LGAEELSRVTKPKPSIDSVAADGVFLPAPSTEAPRPIVLPGAGHASNDNGACDFEDEEPTTKLVTPAESMGELVYGSADGVG